MSSLISRLLFINSRRADYLEDQVFAGLNELLGPERLVAYPTNYHHYFSKYSYPKNMGQCRSPVRFIFDRLLEQQRLRRGDFDAVILGSAKPDVFKTYLELLPRLPKNLPLIFIDGGDRPEIGGDSRRESWEELYRDVLRIRTFALVFKREYVIDGDYPSIAYPLPFGYKPPASISSTTNSRYDVAFWAVESHPIRTEALELIEDRYDCRSNGTVRGQQYRSYRRKGKHYLAELASARIALNFRGVGWDTLRYWEAPGVGTLMISGRPRIVIPDNFEHGKHVLFCQDNLSDLTDLIDYYLANEVERQAIASAGYQHLFAHHTYKHRAQFVVDTLQTALR